MPYQPVERDAGRIMYEAALRRGQTIGGAITDWTNTLYQRQEENKQFDAKVKALEQVYKQNAPQFGFKTPEELTQFLSQDMNQTPKERYARLATFLEDKIVASREQRTQQLQEAQVADLTQQAAVNKQKAAEMQRESEFWSAIEARRQEQARAAGRPGPTDVEGVTRGITEPRAGAVSQFLTPLPRATADQGVPSGVPVMLGGVAAAQPKPARPTVPAPTQPVSATTGGLAYTNEDIDRAAMELPAGAKKADVIKLAMQMAKDRAKSQLQGLYRSQNEAAAIKNQLNADPNSPTIYTEKFIPQAQAWVLEEIPRPLTAAQERERIITTEMGKSRVADITARTTTAREDARMLSEIRPAAAVLRQLYEGGELKGDALAPFKANLAAFAKGLGIPLPAEVEKAEASSQLGQAMMNKMILPLMDRFKGSTSDRDVQLMKAFYPSMATHPEAAMAMLGLLENRIAYVREMDDLAQAWNSRELGDDVARYYAASREIRNRYEGAIPSIDQFSKTYNVTPVKGATQSPSRTGGKSQGIRPEDAKKGVIYIEGSDGLYYPKP